MSYQIYKQFKKDTKLVRFTRKERKEFFNIYSNGYKSGMSKGSIVGYNRGIQMSCMSFIGVDSSMKKIETLYGE